MCFRIQYSRSQVSNSSPWGPQCLLVFGMFSAPTVHLSHWLAKHSPHLVLKALIDSWLRGNHKNLQTLWPPGDLVWHPCSRSIPLQKHYSSVTKYLHLCGDYVTKLMHVFSYTGMHGNGHRRTGTRVPQGVRKWGKNRALEWAPEGEWIL